MHSVSVDSSGSPRKRTISRGHSEDESLRSIISETETSSRRLTRSDSRAGTLKRRSDSQSDKELFMGLPEMLELQASHDEVVQELRGLEVERETLLFQVDVLQDTLVGIEELLFEAQREAGQAHSALEQEREAKRKLESLVCSLTKEVERLKEERIKAADHVDNAATREQTEPNEAQLHGSGSRGRMRPEEEGNRVEGDGSDSTKLRRMVNKPAGHVPSLALGDASAEDGVLRRPCENGVGDRRGSSPDSNDSDTVSAYEDACADTPERDRLFPGDGDAPDLPDDSEAEKSPTNEPKNPDNCAVS